jgi:WD40 repeat protein
VAAGDDSGYVHFWDINTGRLLASPPLELPAGADDPGGIVMDVAFDPRNEFVAAAGKQGVTLWPRVGTGYGPPRTLPLLDATTAVIDPTGRFVAATAEDGTVHVWNRDGTELGDEPLRAEGSMSLGTPSFSTDGRLIAAGNGSGLVQIWDTATGQLLTSVRHHGEFVNDVLILTRDGSTIASASDDFTVAFWSCDACRDPDATAEEVARTTPRR